MKKILTVLVSAVAATAVYGQGYFNFNNLAASGTITIGAQHAAGEGNAGDYVGSSYNVGLYYSTTAISGVVDPSTLTFLAGSTTAFFGTTGSAGAGHSPAGDGAGLFDGAVATINGTADGQTLYAEAVVWWGGAASYSAALAAGQNVGVSAVVPIRLASGTDNTIADMGALTSFTVGIVPEPTTIALGGLGAAALLLFRRRK